MGQMPMHLTQSAQIAASWSKLKVISWHEAEVSSEVAAMEEFEISS